MNDLDLEHSDVKTAFLHSDLDEIAYMKQPNGFITKGKTFCECKLKKLLYGLETMVQIKDLI